MKVLFATVLAATVAGFLSHTEPRAGVPTRATIAIPGKVAMPQKQKVTTFIWFEKNAEEAVRFYTGIFKDARILSESRWGEGGPLPKGELMTARFQIAGQEFTVMNGCQKDRFNDSISLLIDCDNQGEIDQLWDKLCAGGQPGQCGWLKDKYGLSWQVVPSTLGEMMQDKDPAKVRRAVGALLQMKKIEISKLRQAFDSH